MIRFAPFSLLCFSRLLNAQLANPNFWEFQSRPDIFAPRWNIEVYDEDAVTPGYWFVAPYESLYQHTFPFWNGPMIYDQNGHLIWSGAPNYEYHNIFDFRVSRVDGQQMLSLIWPTSYQGAGYILDKNYRNYGLVDMKGGDRRANMHDFNLIDDGKRALMLTTPPQNESYITVPGEFEGPCKIDRQGFKEMDVETGKILFEWNSRDHIALEESTYLTPGVTKANKYTVMCKTYWDITHLNAIDKFDDGDYLLSSRHTSTIYKISHIDGSIIWRLGGLKSDFEFIDHRAIFSRQHHVRFRGQNSTHVLVSLFDNARGDDIPATSSFQSWGLLLALDIRAMTVQIAARYDKPFSLTHSWASARGSVQYLPNGNAFVGWVQGSQIAEYTHDGRMVMSAQFRKTEAASYRCYKSTWVGRPVWLPAVVADMREQPRGQFTTTVWVSWNGDTETASWNLLRTNFLGNVSVLVASEPRTNFETKLVYHGFIRYHVLVALDAKGRELGRSVVHMTDIPDRIERPEVIAAEQQWVREHASEQWSAPYKGESALPWIVFGSISGGLLGFIVAVLILRKKEVWWFSRRPAYESVETEEEEGEDEQTQYRDTLEKEEERDLKLREDGNANG